LWLYYYPNFEKAYNYLCASASLRNSWNIRIYLQVSTPTSYTKLIVWIMRVKLSIVRFCTLRDLVMKFFASTRPRNHASTLFLSVLKQALGALG